MWGISTAIDLKSCDKGLIANKSAIEQFVKLLVEHIKMKAYGEAQIVHFGEGNKEGFTLVQLIETSCITGHFCNSSGDAYIDIFSCKNFNGSLAAKFSADYFCAQKSMHHNIIRGNW